MTEVLHRQQTFPTVDSVQVNRIKVIPNNPPPPHRLLIVSHIFHNEISTTIIVMDTNGSLILWDLSTSGYESVRFLWFERRRIKPATFLLHFSLILWITDENFHLHFHQIFESSPLHCVSASLKYLFVNFQETFFFCCFFLESCFLWFFFLLWTLFFPFFFSALTFVLSSVWVVLGLYPRFFLNGCWISLDEGVSGAGPQRSFSHVGKCTLHDILNDNVNSIAEIHYHMACFRNVFIFAWVDVI